MSRVVYSALIGDYERLVDKPVGRPSGVYFVMFTDSPDESRISGWNVVRVKPRYTFDTVRSARYLKIVGHPLLDAYDETLWIDNRVTLKEGFDDLFSQLDTAQLALPQHSFRGGLVQEFDSVIAMGFDDPARVREMFRIAGSAQLIDTQTLWTGLMLRRRDPEVVECMRIWMDHVLLTSRRDQLSINFAIASSGLSFRAFDLDNWSSPFHEWVSTEHINRNSRIQSWRPADRSMGVRLGDAVRGFPSGLRLARGLTRVGVGLPALPRL